jgi:hypothetical protein
VFRSGLLRLGFGVRTAAGDSSDRLTALEACSMEQLAAMTYRSAGPTQMVTCNRDPFTELQSDVRNQGISSLT